MGIRQDLKDYQTAMNRGWKITDEMKTRIMRECMDVLTNETNARTRLRAAECLMTMEAQNIKIDEAEKAKVQIKLSTPYEQMSSQDNDSVIESIVSGAIEGPGKTREISAEEFIESCTPEQEGECEK